MMREVLSLICCWGTNSDDGGPQFFTSLSQHCAEAAVLSKVKPKLAYNLTCVDRMELHNAPISSAW